MRKLLFSGVVLALATSVASAQLYTGPSGNQRGWQAPVTAQPVSPRQGVVCTFGIGPGGIESNDGDAFFGEDPFGINILETVDLTACAGGSPGQQVAITGIGWDVTLFADANVGPFGGSWLSEPTVRFDDATFPVDSPSVNAINLAPGTDQEPGIGTYSSGGILKLSDFGFDDIQLSTGVASLYFFEGFDDETGVTDGMWLSGSLFLQVAPIPEPATMSLLAIGGLALIRRRFR